MEPDNEAPQVEPVAAHDRAVGGTAVTGTPTTASGAAVKVPPLTWAEKAFLLRLARDSIRNAAGAGPMPHIDESTLSQSLLAPQGCFVTLFRAGGLRGCIGHIFPREPLFRAVIESAQGAAMRDPRFPALSGEEVGELEIEISVLTVPCLIHGEPEVRLAFIQPRRHGVVLRLGARSWTFLPQVWEHFPAPEEFMARLCAKASVEPNAWRDPRVELLIYDVEKFEEGPRL